MYVVKLHFTLHKSQLYGDLYCSPPHLNSPDKQHCLCSFTPTLTLSLKTLQDVHGLGKLQTEDYNEQIWHIFLSTSSFHPTLFSRPSTFLSLSFLLFFASYLCVTADTQERHKTTEEILWIIEADMAPLSLTHIQTHRLT